MYNDIMQQDDELKRREALLEAVRSTKSVPGISPEILSYFDDKKMSEAQSAAAENQQLAGLARAGSMIGGAISGIKPDAAAFDTLKEQAQDPVKQLQAQRQGILDKFGAETKLREGAKLARAEDPNSSISKAYGAMLAKSGVDTSGMTASEKAEIYKLVADKEKTKMEYDYKKMAHQQALQDKLDLKDKAKKLSPTDILKINEGNAIPATLNDIGAMLEDRGVQSKMGPVVGRVSSLNPWDTEARSSQARIKAASQQFGRYMEGGVLRKEDESKYEQMFPQMSDPPTVAKRKLEIVNSQLRRKQAADIKALKDQGYNLEGLNLPEAKDAGRPAAPHEKDQAAVAWAKQNPGDPRAKKILEMNGVDDGNKL